MYRGNDNYINAYDYIKNQLFIYNYNDNSDFQKLKSKIWCLDGPPMVDDIEEGYIDIEVSDPKNHWEALKNEITFLDRYIRTCDDLLNTNELTFSELKNQRISLASSWTRSKNVSGVFNKDYEQPYSTRKTLLTDSQFSDLYTLYKIKESNLELSSAFDIITKISNFTIDHKKVEAELRVDNYELPAITEAKLLSAAELKKQEEDYNFVYEMNLIYDELEDLIISTLPTITKAASAWVYTRYRHILQDAPQKRVQVEIANEDISHKGLIINDEGYRFIVLNEYFGTNVSGDGCSAASGEVEWNWNDWTYYYSRTLSAGGTDECGSAATSGSLPISANTEYVVGAKTQERMAELNKRWSNINRLREDQIQNIGTRAILETMCNASIPNLLQDHIDYFNDRKEQKKTYTKLLREQCIEFI